MHNLRIRTTYFFVAAAWLAPTTVAVSDKPVDDSVKVQLDNSLRKHMFSGAVGVTRDSDAILVQGYGLANAEHQVKNTANTKFRIGSLTKQFTAMGMMILHERGEVKLDVPVSTYLEATPKTWDAVTLHHLLSHTSGVPNFTAMDDYTQKMSLPQTVEQMFGRFSSKPLDFPPGEGFRYSNSGYFVLGMVLESTTGQTYEEFVKEEIFKPLEMVDSGYDHFRTLISNRAEGYDVIDGQRYKAEYLHMSQPFSAGALYSSVNDLLKWDRALRHRRFLSDHGYEKMWGAERSDYAYGWSLKEAEGTRSFVTEEESMDSLPLSCVFPRTNFAPLYLAISPQLIQAELLRRFQKSY